MQILYAYVFQREKPDFEASKPLAPADFKPVAHVLHSVPEISEAGRLQTLDKGFRVTNSIDEPWFQGSKPYGMFTWGQFQDRPIGSVYVSKARSTSIGDIGIVGDVVYRLELHGWVKHEEANALDYLFRIDNAHEMLEAVMLALKDRYKVDLSFGYIGNVYGDGTDDRCWSVFYSGPHRDAERGVSRWGHFDTKDLGTMAARAKVQFEGKGLLENWAEALSRGNVSRAIYFGGAFEPNPNHPRFRPPPPLEAPRFIWPRTESA